MQYPARAATPTVIAVTGCRDEVGLSPGQTSSAPRGAPHCLLPTGYCLLLLNTRHASRYPSHFPLLFFLSGYTQTTVVGENAATGMMYHVS